MFRSLCQRISIFAVLACFSLSAPPSHAFEVVMSGLNNPRGLAFDPAGALYVAEAGAGGSDPCFIVRGQTICYGDTGSVSRYRMGVQSRIATGFPSGLSSNGEVGGPVDIAFLGRGNATIVIGLGADPNRRSELGSTGGYLGHLARMKPNGEWRLDLDVAAYEAASNPDGGLLDSNPYGLLLLPGERIVADAGANALLRVSPSGEISTLAVLPFLPNPTPIGPPLI